MNDTITSVASETLNTFSDNGVMGLVLFVAVVVIVAVAWIAHKITSADTRRDTANADISSRQLKIMADQQIEFSKLNATVANVLNKNNEQFEQIANNSARLNQILESIQITQELERVAIIDNRVEIKRDFNLVMERLERQEKIITDISNTVNEFSKNFSTILPADFIPMLSLWQTAINKSFAEIQLLIKDIVVIQKEREREKEARDYVEKEMDDLFGRS